MFSSLARYPELYHSAVVRQGRREEPTLTVGESNDSER
jgi:hypothetical protein